MLGHGVRGVITLGLDRPQATPSILGDEINPSIGTPTIRPLVPQPHPTKQVAVVRHVLQEPLAEPLELRPTRSCVRIERSEQPPKVLCPHEARLRAGVWWRVHRR